VINKTTDDEFPCTQRLYCHRSK